LIKPDNYLPLAGGLRAPPFPVKLPASLLASREGAGLFSAGLMVCIQIIRECFSNQVIFIRIRVGPE
jgi:hypothetical protein